MVVGFRLYNKKERNSIIISLKKCFSSLPGQADREDREKHVRAWRDEENRE